MGKSVNKNESVNRVTLTAQGMERVRKVSNNTNFDTNYDNVISVSPYYFTTSFDGLYQRTHYALIVNCANLRSKILRKVMFADYGKSRSRERLASKVTENGYIVETFGNDVKKLLAVLASLKDENGNYFFRFKSPERLKHYIALCDNELESRQSSIQGQLSDLVTSRLTDEEINKINSLLESEFDK